MFPRGVTSLAIALTLTGCILYTPIDLGALGGPGELRETVLEGTSGPKIVLVSSGFWPGVKPTICERSPAMSAADSPPVTGPMFKRVSSRRSSGPGAPGTPPGERGVPPVDLSPRNWGAKLGTAVPYCPLRNPPVAAVCDGS